MVDRKCWGDAWYFTVWFVLLWINAILGVIALIAVIGFIIMAVKARNA